MKNRFYFTFLALGLALMACNTYPKTPKDVQAHEVHKKADASTVENLEANMSLVDYIRQLPGVRVSGRQGNYTVGIMGNTNSLNSGNEPLFILDGVPAGHDLNTLNDAITSTDISNVRVIKDGASLSFYGVQGANGVIMIETKKS